MKAHARLSVSILVSVALLTFWTLVADFLAARLVVDKPLANAEVILVLAGSAAYRERTETAASTFHRYPSARILLTNDGEESGWSRAEQTNLAYVELARRALIAQGVPDKSIEILSPPTHGTIMEARVSADKAEERGWRSLLIVTSAHHTRRALQTFETVFHDRRIKTEIGILAAQSRAEDKSALVWWLTPMGWRDVAGEYAKTAYYHFAYAI